MPEFQASLQAWQIFYATLATASATLSGLLFLALSLRVERIRVSRRKTILLTARRTFGDFLYVIVIALVFLVPHQVAFSLSVALLVLALARGIGLIGEILKYFGSRKRSDVAVFIRDLGLPFIVCAGLLEVAIAVLIGRYTDLYNLVAVVTALLLTACWHAWLLLVEE
ncbi:MAG TPA: hypothetical protein VLK33_02070 [Terriglobales bacterium]|nr:hypothetical protein [Terriglobales bacterium]